MTGPPLIYFIKEVQRIDVPKRSLLDLLGYAPNYDLPGIIGVGDERLDDLRARHGSLRRYLELPEPSAPVGGAPDKETTEPNAWIFQANPDRFDIDGYLELTTDITWTVRQKHHASKMAVGDLVFLWRARGSTDKDAGVIAQAEITATPEVMAEDEAGLAFWRRSPDPSDLRVRLRVIERATSAKRVVRRGWLTDDPVLSNLRTLKLANETNYILSDAETERLSDLWQNTGRDWNRAECVAGLWAYDRTYGKEVSRRPDSPVAEVALKIGRALSGVYNKVMNFRSIDPRDPRKGLEDTGDTDKAVWGEFYDPTTQQLLSTTLEHEYESLWPVEGTSPETTETQPEQKRRGRRGRGQGFLSDSIRRKAIENRAMDVATGHYKELGYKVKDTSPTHPFDLRCTNSQGELHVEVKGTTTEGTDVTVTKGEVEHARSRRIPVSLFIVKNIQLRRENGSVIAEGGETQIVENWVPEDKDLRPLTYTYLVPHD